ncbi:NAD dependent epimerase/dehydratase [Aspergillus recurvatus]
MASPDNGQHALLTGADGFVASHILSILLEADDILKTHPSWKGKVKFAIVSNFTSQQPFDELTENTKGSAVPLTYVIHAASPLKFNVKDTQKEMIEPAVMGTAEILKGAHRHGGTTLKRFVLLSSAVSVPNSFEDITREGRPYTEKDWNLITLDRSDTVLGYTVSKTQAEQTAWECMKTDRPNFDLTVINPDIITGPMMRPISGPDSINETNHSADREFHRWNPQGSRGRAIPTLSLCTFPSFTIDVDVRDVARSHVGALTNPAAGGQRILLISGLITPQLVVNIIRSHFPEVKDRVSEGNPSRILPDGIQSMIDQNAL